MGYLEVSDTNISFGSNAGDQPIKVLDGMDLTVDRGEFCCIVGPSGCGKSTSLRIIDGLLRPDSGRVLIDGEEVRGPAPNRAFVFQHFNLLPWRTVQRNVEFGLENQRVPKGKRRRRALDAIHAVGLATFADYYPAQLSGGMQQRVGLARALAVDPEMMLMDEPFGSVDAQTRMLLQEEILRIWEDQRQTIIFVTHDIEEALYLGDRVAVMSPRPSRVVKSVEVPFGRPRSEHIRGDPEFARMKDAIWSELKLAMKEAEA